MPYARAKASEARYEYTCLVLMIQPLDTLNRTNVTEQYIVVVDQQTITCIHQA